MPKYLITGTFLDKPLRLTLEGTSKDNARYMAYGKIDAPYDAIVIDKVEEISTEKDKSVEFLKNMFGMK